VTSEKHAIKSKAVNIAKETPQQLAIGLAIHQSTRSKEVENLLVFPKLTVSSLNVLLVIFKYFCSTLDYQFFRWLFWPWNITKF
jgi:hypothetical protein